MAINADLIASLMTAVRVKSETAKDELTDLAEACLYDLRLSGIEADDLKDPLVRQAVKLYCKANYGYDTDTEKYKEGYQALKIAMALSGEYS